MLPETDWIDDWSPDGQTLLATRGNPTRSVTRADGEIYPLRGLISLTISGTRSVPITTDTEGDFIWPRFSPNGRQIAYYARHHRDGKTAEYAVVAASDGAQPRELVCFTSLEAEDVVKPHGPPCWSPDGMTILFKVTKRPRKQASANLLRFEVVAIAADGTGVRRTPLGTERSWWGFIDCRKRTLRQCRQPFFCPQSLPRFAHLPPSFSTLPSLTDIPSITAVRGADSDPTAPG